ncbi:MAG TPA: hypothetical protein VGB53_07200 [Rubricoccaceae bacterium]|jgi:hypothetical protein
MPRPLLAFLLLATGLAAAGLAACDSAGPEAQRLFEDTAFGSASDGATADDWRVGPALATRVQVVQAASPNPASPGEQVSLQIYADEAPGGFALYRRQPDGGLILVQAQPAQNGPYIYTFTFFGSEASPTGTAGSSRLILYDGFERVVTYGDLVLR